ncbi:DNA cytosine methyltransferase [Chryseobacterium sp. WLY505]|uniref:DNA cytosine methyltransferase n=1 Tax=Chryseobacterium sp. WLY505 TaxID=3068892 RepID=UPI002796DB00|nr:DNA cytosine methyltransferase [Chryseobacterium sp. WLY505]MDQ1855731.1 DNA cytosine methyltransferase [Chryseobacterium sp. WLY505]
MKILNLYACVGGNRKLWGENHEITAVELKPDIAAIYQELYPDDTVVVGDANKDLLDHYHEFDFIWLSRPCTSHSRANFWASRNKNNRKKVMPDLTLYSEIIFLQNWYDGLFVAENVKPYYTPLITYLTKEIEHEGKIIIPLYELQREDKAFTIDFIEIFGYEELKVSVYEKLLEWHFNVFGLPESQISTKQL